MKKVFKESKGFSLVEIILSSALFMILVTTMAGALIYTKDTTVRSGDRGRATLLAEEAVEAIRNIKDEDFTQLTDGTHGLALTASQWDLVGTPDITDNFFTRTIEIASIDANRKTVTTTITWNPRENTTSTYQLGLRLTNWRPPESDNESNYLLIDTTSTYLTNVNKRIYGTTLQNTSSTSDITIASMVVSWTGGNAGTLLDRIRIGGTTVWNPNIVSGATADITDTAITAGAGADELRLHFTDDMSGTIVTIEFTMLDGSTKTTIISFVLSGNEASYLNMDSTGAYLIRQNKRIFGNYLTNTAPFGDITIAQMTISWTGGDPTALLDKIRIGGTTVWTPNVASGTQVDITDKIISVGDNLQLKLFFTKSMLNTIVSIEFLMLDGSIYSPLSISF